MNLHNSIQNILYKADKPLSIHEIAKQLKEVGFDFQKQDKNLVEEEIQIFIKNNPNSFDNLSGKIVSTSNSAWKNLLSAYRYIFETTRNYFSGSDLQFVLASLLFLKRVYDTNKAGENHKIRFSNINSLFFFLSDQNNQVEELLSILKHVEKNRDPLNIFSDFEQLLKRLSKYTILKIFDALDRFETTQYSEENFGSIFEYFLHQISVEFSNLTTPYTPKDLQKVMVAILDPQDGKTLYDPACGSGGLLIESLRYAKGRLDVKGSEIDHRMAQFCYMNLAMNGFSGANLAISDFLEELHNENSYDYVIGDIPLNGIYKPDRYYDLFGRWNILPPKSGKEYSDPVVFVLSKLSEKGKAVITVSETLLFKGGKEKETRELLINKDILECVISLPHGALRPYTDGKASILVINFSKPEELQGKIKFIDSTLTYSDSKSVDININEVVALYRSLSQEFSSKYKLVQREKLTKDLNLSVSTYRTESILAKEMLASGKAIKLGEIVKIRSGVNFKKEDSLNDSGIPVVRIENLSKEILDIYLDIKEIKNKATNIHQYERSLLSQECILIARIGNQLKPTYFKPSAQNKQILLHSSLFALIPNKKENVVDLEYLYYQLHDNFILEQIVRNRVGAVMSSISISRLNEVIIPFVDISAQKEFVSFQKASIISAERAKVEERLQALNYREEIEQKESHIVKTLVHQLRPTLVSINLQVQTFKRIINKCCLGDRKEFNYEEFQHDPDLEDLITLPDNSSLEELIYRFEKDTLHLNDVLTSVNKVMNFNLKSSDKTEIDILQFIRDFADFHYQKETRLYTIEVKGENIILLIHRTSFTELLDQLVINAEKHGFSEISKKTPKLIFDVKKSKDRPVAIIEYQNNGKTFNLTQDEYIGLFTKSQASKGSGIGGNYINRIVKAHGGAIVIDENFTSGFRMTIEMPLLDKEHNE